MKNFLYNRRKELGLTLEEVGNMVGVGKSTVRKWENGMIENMKRDKILALSKALQVSPSDIIGFPDKKETPDTLSDKISKTVSELNNTRQKKVYDFALKQLEQQNNKK